MKVLVSGDVDGNISALFKRVEAVNSKAGPFEMLLCVGSFFGPVTITNVGYLCADWLIIDPILRAILAGATTSQGGVRFPCPPTSWDPQTPAS